MAFCYIYQVTFFLACIVLHLRRIDANRHCCVCVPITSETSKAPKNVFKKCLCYGKDPTVDNYLWKRNVLSRLMNIHIWLSKHKYTRTNIRELDNDSPVSVSEIMKHVRAIGRVDLFQKCKFHENKNMHLLSDADIETYFGEVVAEIEANMPPEYSDNSLSVSFSEPKDVESILRKRRRRKVEGILEWGPPTFINWLFTLKHVRIFLIFLYVAYLSVAIWGVTKYKEGLVVRNLVSEDSYFYRYSTWDKSYFSSSTPVSFIIQSKKTYSDPNTIKMIQNLQSIAQNDASVENGRALNWLTDFMKSRFYVPNATESAFISSLRTNFLPTRPFYKNDISFDSTNSSIQSSRFFVFTKDIKDSTEQGKLMSRMRDLAERYGDVIAFSPSFIFYEQYIAILPNTLQTVGAAVVAIFIVTAIFMPSLKIIAYVTVSMVSIMVGLFGYMFLWDLTLSSVTMIHIIMSVGFSVDFSAHICHGYLSSKHDTNEGKIQEAIRKAGGPIFNGALSSFIGIIMLSFSRSYIFRSFFKVMFLILVLGVLHSLIFLPVLLSFQTKPRPKSRKTSNEMEMAHSSTG